MKLKEIIEVYDASPNERGNRSIRIYPNSNDEGHLDMTLKSDGDGKSTLSAIIGYQILDRNVIKVRIPDFNMMAVYLGADESDQEVEELETVESPFVEPEPDTEIEEQPDDVEAEESEGGTEDNKNEGEGEAPEAEEE